MKAEHLEQKKLWRTFFICAVLILFASLAMPKQGCAQKKCDTTKVNIQLSKAGKNIRHIVGFQVVSAYTLFYRDGRREHHIDTSYLDYRKHPIPDVFTIWAVK